MFTLKFHVEPYKSNNHFSFSNLATFQNLWISHGNIWNSLDFVKVDQEIKNKNITFILRLVFVKIVFWYCCIYMEEFDFF